MSNSLRYSAQSPKEIPAALIQTWVERTHGEHLRTDSPNVWQWTSATPLAADLREVANAQGVDLNAIDASWRWSDLGLLASDMDSTLITVECIDEIADFAGLKEKVAHITERAMRGEIAFPQALRERVAMLKGLSTDVLAQVYTERVRLSPGARELVADAHRIGAISALVSGGFTFFTQAIKNDLGLTHTLANVLGVDGTNRLNGEVVGDIVDGEAKARLVATLKHALPAGKLVIAMGDGANDLPMMQHAHISVAYRAKPAVRARASVWMQHCSLNGVRRLFPA